jgi:hypothetical protein
MRPFSRQPRSNGTSAARNDASPARVEQFAPPVERHAVAAAFAAWCAARSGVSLQCFMTARFAFYDRSRPPYYLTELPTLEGVTPRLEPNRAPDLVAAVLSDPAGVDPQQGGGVHAAFARFVRYDQQTAAAVLTEDLHHAEADLQRVEIDIRDAEEAVEESRTQHISAIAAGRIQPSSTLARSARSRDRPRAELNWARGILLVGEAAVVLTEAYAFLPPLLDMNGILVPQGDVFALAPTQVFPSAALALVVAVAAFAGVSAALSAALGRGSWHLHGKGRFVIAIAAGAAAGLLLVSIAVLRQGFGVSTAAMNDALAATTGSAPPAWPFFGFTLGLPPLAALVHEWIFARDEGRRERVAARDAFDAKEREAIDEGERRAELARLAEELRSASAAERETIRARIRALQKEAQDAEVRLRREHEARLAFGHAWARAVIAALETDRYAFEVAARRRGRGDLLDGGAEDSTSGVHSRGSSGSGGAVRQLRVKA